MESEQRKTSRQVGHGMAGGGGSRASLLGIRGKQHGWEGREAYCVGNACR